MTEREMKNYAFKYRMLVPYKRREKAFKKMQEALALLQDEIDIQDSYRQMDYSALKTGHYKWACKLLKIAIESMELEQDEHVWKILHKGGI